MSEVIFLSDVRLSFPHIAEPQKQINEQTGKERISYNCEFIMPQNHPGFAQFWTLYQKMMTEAFAEHAGTVMQMIQNDRKLRGFGMGSEKSTRRPSSPTTGTMATCSSRPAAIACADHPADGNPVDPANTMACVQLARRLYGGCRVNAAVKPWVQKNKHGNGIRFDLVAVQFLRDDVAFGEGAVDVTGLFGQVAPQAGPSAAGMQAPTMPGFMGGFAPAPAAPAMPAPPFGAPAPVGLPAFFGR